MKTDPLFAITTNINGTTHIWDISTGEIINSYYKNIAKSNCTVFHTNVIISSQNDKAAIHIYNLKKDQPTFQCAMPEKLTSMAISPDGNFCFGGSELGTIFVWQTCTGQLVKLFSGHIKTIECLAVTPDSSILLSGGADTMCHVWSLSDILNEQTRDSRKIQPLHSWSSHSLAISSVSSTIGSHTKILTTSLDRTAKIFHLSTGTEICSIGFPSALTCGILNATEQSVFCGSSNGSIYQTDLYPYTPQYVNSSSGTKNMSLEYKDDQIFKGHTDSITGIAITDDNTKLISCSKDGTSIVWDIKTKQVLHIFKKHSGTVPQPITNVIVTTIPKERFTEKYSSDFVIAPFKKFVGGVSTVTCRLNTNTWQDLAQDFEVSTMSNNIGCIDVIKSEKVNITNRLQKVLNVMK
jgi:pre-rRNA-processing protein IPI3